MFSLHRRMPLFWQALAALLLLLNPIPAPTTAASPTPAQPNLAAQPLAFEPNRGQADTAFSYLAHTPDGSVGFLPTGLIYQQVTAAPRPADPAARITATTPVTTTRLSMRWQGSNPNPRLSAADPLPGVVNYLRGSDPAHWQRDVPTYRQLTYTDLYPGISLHYGGDAHGLKGTYTVAPNADPTLIRWRYDAPTPTLDPSGNLQIAAPTDSPTQSAAAPATTTLIEQAPVAWQETAAGRAAVPTHYTIAADGSISFALAPYDHSRPLVLDPYLLYSTPLGWGFTYGRGIKVDVSGAIYVTGATTTNNFPTVNPAQGHSGGDYDAYVSKISPDGASLVYSTYLGGNAVDAGLSIDLDAANQAYITGYTGSADFPVTPGAFDTTVAYTDRAFITVLNAQGDGLIYSTFLGEAEGQTYAYGIAVTPDGWATVTGNANCRCFPERRALFPADPAVGIVGQGFVARFTPAGQMDYGTIIPGTVWGLAVALDAVGNAYIGGYTEDFYPGFFPRPRSVQGDASTGREGFVIALAADGSRELYGTFLGGSGDEEVDAVAVSPAGEATVSGWSRSGNFFPPVGPLLQTAPLQPDPGGLADGFVARFSVDGSSLAFATFLGGGGDDFAWGVAVDDAGATYITGSTTSTNFPTSHAVQWRLLNTLNRHVFLTKLNPAGSGIAYSTYLGGIGGEAAAAIALDTYGNAYITGHGESRDFPTARPLSNVGDMDGGSFITIIGDHCDAQFSDVPDGSVFYPYVRALACRGVASGYADGTFRIGATLTRGQMAKIVSAAANLHPYISPFQQTFADVPQEHPFWREVENAAAAGIISGYNCGQLESEPCDDSHRPYFRPYASVTRGQTAKIVTRAMGWTDEIPPTQRNFADIAPTDTFWLEIELLKLHGAISGYSCGQLESEPCLTDLPYYRPYSGITRGQSAKIVATTFYPNDEVPQPTPTPTAPPSK